MHNLNNRGIVILGGTGLVGRACKDYFARKGVEVFAPDKENFHVFENKINVSSQIISKMEIYPILDAIHLVAEPNKHETRDETTYIEQLSLILQKRDKNLSFTYLSSGAVYGDHQEMIRQSSKINPISSHGHMKISLERDVQEHFMQHKIYRLFFPYGDRIKSERLLPSLIEKIKIGQPIRCNLDGGPLISIIDVKDLSEVLFDEIRSEWLGIKNIAGGERIRIADIAKMIGGVLGQEPLFEVNEIATSNCYAEEYDLRHWRKLENQIQKIVQNHI
jgi:nucleoside-diphosphate-sugar epimerase